MKYILLPFVIAFLMLSTAMAQTGRQVSGMIIDTTQLSVPGTTVKYVSNAGDSTATVTGLDGKFVFNNVKGTSITVTITSLGYEGIRKRFNFADNDAKPLDLGTIVLKAESKTLNQVNIVGVIPVKIKEDTVAYSISAYPVRENAPVEDVIKKLPGVEVDAAGNVTTQGKSVTKIRINGKDYMGGDLQAATRNLPADILESIQLIDDYGDQANLTGVRTGEPDKIINLTIRKDRNYGYSLQATGGGGSDLQPKVNGKSVNAGRYVGSANYYQFNGDRQITVLANMNNTNTNTFNFSGGGGGGGFGGGGGGGGGGFGGGAGGGGGRVAGGGVSNRNGITDAKAIGINYRDQWGKVANYGSYSFADNTTNTTTSTLQTNTGTSTNGANNSIINNSSTSSTDNPVNHRFQYNFELRPDTATFIKVVPSFNYSTTNSYSDSRSTLTQGGTVQRDIRTITNSNSSSPNYGLTALFNRRLSSNGRNISVFLRANGSRSTSFSNPNAEYFVGSPTAGTPRNQEINQKNTSTSYNGNISYLEPLFKDNYLDINYTFSRSNTSNDRQTLDLDGATPVRNELLSNAYDFSFTTHRGGLNYRLIKPKYNLTVGAGIQQSSLEGQSTRASNANFGPTKRTQNNIIPTLRFLYNFSRNESLTLNYNANATNPSFDQLQPVTDYSNQLYPVEGNPNLKQQFNHNVSLRYNTFGIASGNLFFINASYNKIDDYVATRQTTDRSAVDPVTGQSQPVILRRYLNTDGYYSASGTVLYSMPWAERKYTISVNTSVNYTNDIGFVDNISTTGIQSPIQKNIAKYLTLSPGTRFRVDITDIVDVQASFNYSISKVNNTLESAATSNSNIRAAVFGLSGKNYFGDWTLSYDLTKTQNSGYNIPVTNPTIISAYLERRFLKANQATIRLAAFDLLNQNTGFQFSATGNTTTQTQTNRLGRYFMATFTLRLQKFAGKAPAQPENEFRRGGPGGPGGPGGRGPGGGGGFGGGGRGPGGGGF